MGDQKVNLVRPDGSVLQATQEQAGRLRLLGYQEENPDDRFDRNVEEGKSNYYSTTGQKVLAGAEGFGSSLTLGASDYLWGDDDTENRAKYNPGSRMAGEALGALVPLVVGDGAGFAGLAKDAAEGIEGGSGLARGVGSVARSAVEYSPSGLVTKGAAAVLGEGNGLLPAVMRGAAEGAVYGGTNEADHAYLSGDPLTAEAVLHGVGWGALFGAGLGAVGAGAEKAGAHFSQEVKASGELTSGAEQTAKVSEEAYGQLHSEIQGLKSSLKGSLTQADAMVNEGLSRIDDLRSGMTGDSIDRVGASLKAAYSKASTAIEKGDSVAAESALSSYESSAAQIAKKMDLPDATGVKQALSDLKDMRSVHKELGTIPKTASEFKAMTPAKAERVFATLDQAQKLSADPIMGKAVGDAIAKYNTAVGLNAAGTDGLKASWELLRKAPMKAEAAGGGSSLAQKVVGTIVGAKAGSAMRKATGSEMLGLGAYKAAKSFFTGGGSTLASGLMGARNAVLGKVRQIGADYLPGIGRAAQSLGPKIEPLAVKLDGSLDNSTKDQRQLALNRVQEINRAAPHVADTLYRAVEPLKATQPVLAPALHQTAMAAFTALQGMAPKDPGAISKLKTLWKPDPSQADVLKRQLQVFHDPVTAADDMLKSGRFDPVKVEALQTFSPEIYQQLRVSMMERVTQPDIMAKMTYGDQVVVSALLDIPIHSSMASQFIAGQQQMFTQRNQPLATPKVSMPGGSNGGRPSGPANNKDSTASQRITEH